SQLRRKLLSRLESAREKLDELALRRCFRMPLERLCDEERRLDDWSVRMMRAVRQRIGQSRQRLEANAGRLEGLSPLNVLARGYSLTHKENEKNILRTT